MSNSEENGLEFQEFDLERAGATTRAATTSPIDANDDADDDEAVAGRMEHDKERQVKWCSNEQRVASCRVDTAVSLRPVLNSELSACQVASVCVAVARLTRACHTSTVVRALSVHFAAPHLIHVKRVRHVPDSSSDGGLYVVLDTCERLMSSELCDRAVDICSAQTNTVVADCRDDDRHRCLSPPAPALLPGVSVTSLLMCSKVKQDCRRDAVADLCARLSADVYVALVPVSRPLLRRQHERACLLWPTHFHQDRRLEALAAGAAAFSTQQREILAQRMRLALQAARSGGETARVGCVVVEPGSDGRVVASSGDRRWRPHPLHHATMLAVDLVAHAQGGGAWHHHPSSSPSQGLVNAGGSEALVTAGSQHTGRTEQYLCTGYDVFVTREPCLMCAMALLHSRVARVFYGESRQDGALGSAWRLHTLPGINHRFQVFSGLLESDCAALNAET